MKKLFFLFTLAAFGMSFISCGGSKEKDDDPANKGARELLDTVTFSVDGLVGMIKSDSAYTEDEYRALILAQANEEIDSTTFNLKKLIVQRAKDKLRLVAPKNSREIRLSFIKHENPVVRATFIVGAQDFMGVTEGDIQIILNMIQTEKHPYVIINALKTLSNDMSKPEVAKFVFAQAKSEIPAIRKAAALAICNGHSVGVEGTTAAALELFNDPDIEVKKAVMGNCGRLGDEAFVPELAKVLNDTLQYDLHGDCADSLYDMWYDFPFHKKTSEAAYNATVEYLSKTPRNEKQPDWIAVGGLKVFNKDKIGEWKNNAKYFNQQKFLAIMNDIINDPNSSYNAKHSAKLVVEKWSGK